MSSKFTKLENSTGEILVTCDGDTWKKAQEKVFNKVVDNTKVDGFRKGKAPKNIVEKQINKQALFTEAVDEVASNILFEAIKEHDLQVISRPELDIVSVTEEKVDLKFIVTLKPEVTLGDYKGLKIKKEKAYVTDDDVDGEVDKLRSELAELLLKEEGEVVLGDTAVIDFKGFLGDEAFEGGSGENYPLEIGSGSFIPGFEEQIVGLKTGDSKDVNVTFPEAYQAEHLAGKDVVFKVDVKEIKEKVLPEVNDELAANANLPEVKTVDELKKSIRSKLETQAEAKVEEKYQSEIANKITESAKVDIPAAMISQETEFMYNDFVSRLQQQGYNEELYFSISGQTKEQLLEQFKEDSQAKVKLRLVLEEIAKKEDLKVNEEEVEKEYNNIAEQYHMELDKVKEVLDNAQVSYDLKLRKAIELVEASTV